MKINPNDITLVFSLFDIVAKAKAAIEAIRIDAPDAVAYVEKHIDAALAGAIAALDKDA